MPLNSLLICCLSSHTISSLSLCSSEHFLGQRRSGEPESVWVWAGRAEHSPPGAGLLLAAEHKEINILWVLEAEGCAGSCQEDVNSSRGRLGAPWLPLSPCYRGLLPSGRRRNLSGIEKMSVCVLPFWAGVHRGSASTRDAEGGREQPLVSAAWGGQALAPLECCGMRKERELL